MALAPGRVPDGCMRDHSASPAQNPGESQRPSSARQPAQGCSSLPIIGRRLPASSSFVLASALTGAYRLRALRLDPGPRDGTNRQRRGKPQQQSHPTQRPS